MISLGLDPSLAGFGWCVHDGSVSGPGRVVAKGVTKTKPTTVYYLRFIHLRALVAKLLVEYPQIKAVGVESPPFGESYSPGLFGLFAYVNEAIMLARKDVVYFDPLRVKLLAKMDPDVRKGRMEKDDMVDIAKQDTGIEQWNHNEADAYILARSAARFWEFHAGDLSEDELTPAERTIFCGSRTYLRGHRAGKTLKTGVLFKEGERFYQFSKVSESELEIRF